MKFILIVLILFSGSFVFYTPLHAAEHPKDFNLGWKFSLADDATFASISFNDKDWDNVQLPHDWSVSFPFDSIKGEGATGYLPGGIGWYRKHFKSSAGSNQLTYLLFDAVYNNATVYVNGKKIGFHPYGYSPFYYDISGYLNKEGDNVIAVRVDHSRYVDSRWYTGSGIYRNVQLIVKDKLSIPVWGTSIITPLVSEQEAQVLVKINVRNNYSNDHRFFLKTTIYDAAGKAIATSGDSHLLASTSVKLYEQAFTVLKPQLWEIDNPKLYRAVSEVELDGETKCSYTTTFGIRSIRFDSNEGFFLNGKSTKIKGVCLHHDAGLAGAAVPKGVWQRRLAKLKEAGCNAIRISHNPGSAEFLDLCDEMGFLVQEEFFDEWDYPKDKRLNMKEKTADYVTRGYAEYFQDWAEADLKSTMLRDRNHPSIFQWSIGNEIEWTYPRYAAATGYFEPNWGGNYFWTKPPLSPTEMLQRFNASKPQKYELAKTAAKLSKWTRELDTTRPVVANTILPAISHLSGYADALDIVGYSYGQVLYDYGHELYPDKVIMGTESLGQWHEWKAVSERPFIAGTFYWTGIDYMGEVNKQWPVKATASGLLDVAGFEKPSWYMMKALWRKEPQVYLVTQTLQKSLNKQDSSTNDIIPKNKEAWKRFLWIWNPVNHHWNYERHQLISTEVYSNCPEVELFLNGKSLGRKYLADFEDHVYKWVVPFEGGTLEARATATNGTVVSDVLQTSSKPVGVHITSDKDTLAANGYDVAHITLQLIDKDGIAVVNEDRPVEFTVEGPAKTLGIDNGGANNVQPYQSNKIITRKGQCLLIIQSTNASGKINITASGESLHLEKINILSGLVSSEVSLSSNIKPAAKANE